MGRRDPVLRHLALVRHRPIRASPRRLPAGQTPGRIRYFDQGRPHPPPLDDATVRAPPPRGVCRPPDFEVRFDYSYDGVVRAWEDSLQRLGLARVDLLLIHDLDRIYFPHGADYDAHLAQLVTGGYQALRDLRADGRIKAIGCGVNIPGQIPQFLDLFDLDFFLVAGPYTLLEQTTLDTELERCRLSGVSLVIGAAFRYGILATGTKAYTGNGPVVLGEDELEKAKRIERVCEKLGVPLAAAAIQFPFGHPSVRSVLFGAIDGDQVRQTVENLKRPVPVELWERLRAEGLVATNAPVPSGT